MKGGEGRGERVHLHHLVQTQITLMIVSLAHLSLPPQGGLDVHLSTMTRINTHSLDQLIKSTRSY